MADFESYSPEDVIGANLRETAERADMVWEQEMAHLRELAAQIVADSSPSAEFPHTLPEHSPPKTENTVARLVQCKTFLQARQKLRDAERSVYLCMELRKQVGNIFPLSPEHFFPEAETLSEHALGRIAYQRNSYTDSVYLRFASLIPVPRALYSHSFPALCEEVYNGLCEYCILPLESSAEGQLNSFSRLIDRYGLKIAATCDIPATDGMRSTRFALLRKDIVPFPTPKGQEQYFEFSAPLSVPPTSAELLSAAQMCGLTLHRLDCRPCATAESENDRCIHYVFRIGKGDLIAFLLYLSMEAPHCEPTGIYFHLSD